MENKELIRMIVNFDDDSLDTSTGFNSVTSSKVPEPIDGFRFVWYVVNYPYGDKEKRDKENPFANWLNTIHDNRWGTRYITNMTVGDMFDNEEVYNDYTREKSQNDFCVRCAENMKVLWGDVVANVPLRLSTGDTYVKFKEYKGVFQGIIALMEKCQKTGDYESFHHDVLRLEYTFDFLLIYKNGLDNLLSEADKEIYRNYFERVYGTTDIKKDSRLWNKIVSDTKVAYMEAWKDFFKKTVNVMGEIIKTYPIWCEEHE